MQVRDGFPAVPAVVNDQAVATGFETEAGRHCGGLQEEVAQHRLVLRLRLRHARDWLFGNDQDMNGRLRIDVVQGQHQVILVGDSGRNLPGDNFLEESLAHEGDGLNGMGSGP